MRSPRVHLTAVTLCLATSLAGSTARAQSIWLPPASHSQISLEAMKSVYDPSDGVAFMSTAWYLSGWARLSPMAALYMELPYSYYEEEFFDGQDAMGNPYVGLVYGSAARKGFVMEVGGRLPVVGEADFDENVAAILNGWATDVTRMEAFAPQVVSIRFRFGGYAVSDPVSGMFLRFLAGGHIWIPTEEGEEELMADVDIALWKIVEKFSVGAVLSAKSLLTESDLSLSERSEFQLGLSGSMLFGRVEPGVHAHLPLSNEGLLGIGEFQDVVLGVHCTVHLAD